MIKLTDLLKEIKIEKPKPPQIPEGWEEYEMTFDEDEKEEYGGDFYKGFSAPMEGWDQNHSDYVFIVKTPDGKYELYTNLAYGDTTNEETNISSAQLALKKAIEKMEELKEDWDEEEEEDEED